MGDPKVSWVKEYCVALLKYQSWVRTLLNDCFYTAVVESPANMEESPKLWYDMSGNRHHKFLQIYLLVHFLSSISKKSIQKLLSCPSNFYGPVLLVGNSLPDMCLISLSNKEGWWFRKPNQGSLITLPN